MFARVKNRMFLYFINAALAGIGMFLAGTGLATWNAETSLLCISFARVGEMIAAGIGVFLTGGAGFWLTYAKSRIVKAQGGET